jgi:hypothetical protein
MIYSNLEEIIEEFKLKEKDPEKIRKKLRKMAADLHPDKTSKGAKFKSEKQKNQYNRIIQAKEFIDNMSNQEKAIVEVPLQQLTELIDATKQITISDSQSKLNIELIHQIEKSVLNLKLKHRFPKIGLATITGIFTFIWMFPNIVQEHPIISQYVRIDNIAFTLIWIYLLFFTGVLWIFYWMGENRYKEEMSKLKVESYQNRLFDSFINEDRFFEKFHDENHRKNLFSKEDFIDYLSNHYYQYKYHRHNLKLTLYNILYKITIDLETAQHLANSIFSRLENKNIIKKVDTTSLNDFYVYNYDRVSDI